ncbi:MAG: cation:proton antiporter regulatory subunit [Actinobacteria bacterium]|nr:cation:proton antiporter regulatory subunit [Actinomycetota bacterium]
MSSINETRLPGIGTRFDFVTQEGAKVVLINHHSGRCEVLLCSKEDPDACREVMRLAKEDVRALAEILGQTQITEEVASKRLSLQGLAIDWLPVDEKAPCANCSLYDIEHKDDEAAAIVAVIRGDSTIAAPPSAFILLPGDIAVVVGTPRGVETLATLLRGS